MGTSIFPGHRGTLWHGSLWAEKQHNTLEALQSSQGSARVKDWQVGSEKSHLMHVLCGHTLPDLTNSCVHKYFFELWGQTAINMLCSSQESPIAPLLVHTWSL